MNTFTQSSHSLINSSQLIVLLIENIRKNMGHLNLII